jgi:hypothetical protein
MSPFLKSRRLAAVDAMSSYVLQLVVDTRLGVTLIPTIKDPPWLCETIQRSVGARYSGMDMR